MDAMGYLPKLKKDLIQTVVDIINLKISIQTTSNAMADREKKNGRRKYKNLNMLRTKRAF